jgi:hypothetical protein
MGTQFPHKDSCSAVYGISSSILARSFSRRSVCGQEWLEPSRPSSGALTRGVRLTHEQGSRQRAVLFVEYSYYLIV